VFSLEIPGWLQFYSTASSEYDEYLKVTQNRSLTLFLDESGKRKDKDDITHSIERTIKKLSALICSQENNQYRYHRN
jgi:hypothetical protein